MTDITFDLTNHCIETAAKKNYERLIRRYLKKETLPEEKAGIEDRMEILKYFLEHADFPRLRSRYPLLSGNHSHQVVISVGEGNKDITLKVNDTMIDMTKEKEWKRY